MRQFGFQNYLNTPNAINKEISFITTNPDKGKKPIAMCNRP